MFLSKDPRAALRAWVVTGSPPRPESPSEVEVLVRTAHEQGVAGLLHNEVSDCWPSSAVESLRRIHLALLGRGVGQLDLARRVHRILIGRGLRSLPLKGAALAERLYPTVAERPMSDVDVLALDDWASSVAALRDHGLVERERADHAWSFVDPVTSSLLELHRGLTSCPGFFPVDAEGLWARSLPGGGQVPRLPSAEDLLVHLALHAAFQHGFVLSLVQYVDFRRLLSLKSVDPDRLYEIAARSRAEAVVAWTLRVAAVVVEAPMSPRLIALFPAPRGSWPRLSQGLRDPLALLAPAVPALLSARWALAAGRRSELLRRTLQPAHGSRRSGVSVGRALTLASRWARSALHGAGPGARTPAG
jgi:Uncharacterised nucleotidyltransferase